MVWSRSNPSVTSRMKLDGCPEASTSSHWRPLEGIPLLNTENTARASSFLQLFSTYLPSMTVCQALCWELKCRQESRGSHSRAHSPAQGTDIQPEAVMSPCDVLLKEYTGSPNEYRTRKHRTGPNKLRKDPLCPPTNPMT